MDAARFYADFAPGISVEKMKSVKTEAFAYGAMQAEKIFGKDKTCAIC